MTTSRPTDLSRLRLVLVPASKMADVLRGGPVAPTLPADAEVIRGHYDKELRCFRYVVRSREFASVGSSDPLPVHG